MHTQIYNEKKKPHTKCIKVEKDFFPSFRQVFFKVYEVQTESSVLETMDISIIRQLKLSYV